MLPEFGMLILPESRFPGGIMSCDVTEWCVVSWRLHAQCFALNLLNALCTRILYIPFGKHCVDHRFFESSLFHFLAITADKKELDTSRRMYFARLYVMLRIRVWLLSNFSVIITGDHTYPRIDWIGLTWYRNFDECNDFIDTRLFVTPSWSIKWAAIPFV